MEGTQRKRQFTEAQLARKREVDRMNNMAKRAQQRQIQQLENQVTVLQQTVEGLTEQIGIFNQLLSAQDRAAMITGTVLTPPTPASPTNSSFTSTVAIATPKSAFSDDGDDDVPVDCRCGMDHHSRHECLEYLTFYVVLKAHQTLRRDVTDGGPLPRTPSLLHVFHPMLTANPVVQILGLVFGRIRPPNVPTFFACYMLMYRFLRWRLYPHEEILQDLPQWTYPTEMQKTVPHPISIDFIPWPRLRDHMIGLAQSPERDPRHSVLLYVPSIRFNWPESKNFMYISPDGDLRITDDFEAALYTYENWRLSREWAAMFPHLTDLVNVEHETRG